MNEASGILNEYLERKELATIGIHLPEVDTMKADCFMIIASEIRKMDQIEARRRKK